MLKPVQFIFAFYYSFVFINCINVCDDWSQYKDIKCVKALKEKTNEKEARERCLELDKSSTLLAIFDQEEQGYINKLLVEFSNFSISAWIGMKYNGNEYDWVDGTDSNYTNWSDNAIREGDEPCVQMSLVSGIYGQWFDESCKKTALIVCQKRQEINVNVFKDVIDNMSEMFKINFEELDKQNRELKDELRTQLDIVRDLQGKNIELKDELDQFAIEITNLTKKSQNLQEEVVMIKNNYIPFGFIYTQLPFHLAPQKLWPELKWTEVTKQYAGLFFRVEGKGSEPFGQIQQANQSYLSDIKIQSVRYNSWVNSGYQNYDLYESFDKNGGKWKILDPFHVFDKLWLYMTESEVRPKNTAIKIWMRT